MSTRRLFVPGIGLGWRVEIAADLLASPTSVDLIEAVADACFASPAARREALAISRIWPVVPHGVKLSLGSAEGIDLDRASARRPRSRSPRGGGREIRHLTQLPFTREAGRVVAANVAAARRVLVQLVEAQAQLAALQTHRAARKRRKVPDAPSADWLLVEGIRDLLHLSVGDLATRLGLAYSTVLGRAQERPLSPGLREKLQALKREHLAAMTAIP